MRLAPGTQVGPYEFLAPVGAGGMGEVYRARDPRLGREVAIKVLPLHRTGDPDAVTRFERESRAVAALSHPNILAIYDVGTHEGASYAVTELLEGETLRARLERSRLPWTGTAEIGAAIAEGVAAAHSRGIIHRDLKPENIFLTSDGRVKILDFGLARVTPAPSNGLASQTPTETQAGTILGTVGYMSPEQVRGESAEAPSDIFSLGCVLYEMVSGRRPFARETGVQTLSAILESEPAPLSGSGRAVPEELDRIISRCLEKNPALRMQSARDLSFALSEVVKSAHRISTSVRRRRLAYVASGALAAVVLAGLAAGPLRKRILGTAASAPTESLAVPPLENLSGAPRPVNPEAYQSFLRARYLSTRTTDADSREAVALLERAVALDPGFAPAHALLAAAYFSRLNFVVPEEARALEQRAYAAAEHALSLDPGLAEAYVARGNLLWSHSFRFAHDRAVQEYRRALSLNPDLDRAHEGLARVFIHLGFFEEALEHAARAMEINPSNALAPSHRAQAYLWMGKNEEALAALSSVPPSVVPESVEANTAWALFRLGRPEEALSRLRRASREHPDDASGVLPGMEALLLADSDPRRAEDLIAKATLKKAVGPAHHTAYFVGCAWARMGRAEEAIQALREAAETGFPCYPLFARDESLDPIRQDTRFQEFLEGMRKQSEALRRALFPVSN